MNNQASNNFGLNTRSLAKEAEMERLSILRGTKSSHEMAGTQLLVNSSSTNWLQEGVMDVGEKVHAVFARLGKVNQGLPLWHFLQHTPICTLPQLLAYFTQGNR